MVDWLKEASDGRPIGVKIAAGHVEQDLEWIAYADADFVTIDGRGGATGASPRSLKDNYLHSYHFSLSTVPENIWMNIILTWILLSPEA